MQLRFKHLRQISHFTLGQRPLVRRRAGRQMLVDLDIWRWARAKEKKKTRGMMNFASRAPALITGTLLMLLSLSDKAFRTRANALNH